ncbi:GbsR/MarR family transcriptional regulator [Occultella gossypii]|uniref:MarR family transcriptional regulator n=1 Tax=Occultella gossypii TaxID=2800820 RepID=A0ABS7S4Q9_9MICO|nr:hypothetical protein [Occultella gossypii]MBZ2195334.1 hypothetical protein [Occultella gossypii]
MPDPSESEAEFVEDVARFFTDEGLPAVAGRVIGWLLICDPPEQTAAQLAGALDASRSSIGNATRMLTPSGLIEGRRRRGERQEYFRIAPDGWSRMLAARYAKATAFRDVIVRGLDALADAPADRRERLEHVDELYEFLQAELPGLWERWETRDRPGRAQGRP